MELKGKQTRLYTSVVRDIIRGEYHNEKLITFCTNLVYLPSDRRLVFGQLHVTIHHVNALAHQ